ncbi:Uncharacterized protein SCF082_LOCUS4228 [Durusdinium trenchii]
MGSVRAYDPNPPKNDAEVDISKFEFKHVQCTVQPNGTGWSRYKIVLPASVRQLYANDVVYGPEWRELLSDFDRRFGTTASEAPIAPPPEPEPELPVTLWSGEPTTVDEILNQYYVEAKISGRTAGTTFFVVDAKRRTSGVLDQVSEHQTLKLFMVAHATVTIPDSEFILAHGSSRWIRGEKFMEMKRKGLGRACSS